MLATRRKAELVKNVNCTIRHTHGFNLRNIRKKKQVQEEGVRKLMAKVAFQNTNESGGKTWYKNDVENYSTTSGVT